MGHGLRRLPCLPVAIGDAGLQHPVAGVQGHSLQIRRLPLLQGPLVITHGGGVVAGGVVSAGGNHPGQPVVGEEFHGSLGYPLCLGIVAHLEVGLHQTHMGVEAQPPGDA